MDDVVILIRSVFNVYISWVILNVNSVDNANY